MSDLEGVVEAAGVERFTLLGISQGGPVAVAYTARHPERVRALILLSSYARGWKHRSLEERELRKALETLIVKGWGRPDAAFRQVFSARFIPQASAEQMRWLTDLQSVSTSAENAARFWEGFGSIDVRPLLADIRTPALVLHARTDPAPPFEEGRLLAVGLPNARFVAFDSPNHLLLEHEPAWQIVLQEIRRFLSELTDAPTERTAEASPLTAREREVVALVVQGLSNRDIAKRLVISPGTAERHVANILAKLDFHSRAQIAAWAARTAASER